MLISRSTYSQSPLYINTYLHDEEEERGEGQDADGHHRTRLLPPHLASFHPRPLPSQPEMTSMTSGEGCYESVATPGDVNSTPRKISTALNAKSKQLWLTIFPCGIDNSVRCSHKVGTKNVRDVGPPL